jgi:hypothetical protein
VQTSVFCCQSWRNRPPASHRSPALIPHPETGCERTQKVLQTRMFCPRSTYQAGHPSSIIPRGSPSRSSARPIAAGRARLRRAARCEPPVRGAGSASPFSLATTRQAPRMSGEAGDLTPASRLDPS